MVALLVWFDVCALVYVGLVTGFMVGCFMFGVLNLVGLLGWLLLIVLDTCC